VLAFKILKKKNHLSFKKKIFLLTIEARKARLLSKLRIIIAQASNVHCHSVKVSTCSATIRYKICASCVIRSKRKHLHFLSRETEFNYSALLHFIFHDEHFNYSSPGNKSRTRVTFPATYTAQAIM